MAGLLERDKIPLWFIPAEFVGKAVRRRGVSPSDVEGERDGAPGVLLRAGIGERVIDEATALWQAARSAGHVIQFGVQLQERELWCWAAVALSVAEYYLTDESDKDQCEVVSEVLGVLNCCGKPEKAACNEDEDLETPLEHLEVDHSTEDGPTDLADLQPAIDDNLLVCLRVEWASNDMGHFAVISAWWDDPVPAVWIEDPAGYYGWVDLDQLHANTYRGKTCTWTDTYFTEESSGRIRVPDDVWDQVLADAGGGSGVLDEGGPR